MLDSILPEDVPREPVYVFMLLIVIYIIVSLYLATEIFPQENLLDYGIGKTSYTNLYAGPIAGLRDFGGPGSFFGVLGYLISSVLLFGLIFKALFSKTWLSRIFFLLTAAFWWFMTGAANFGPGYIPFP